MKIAPLMSQYKRHENVHAMLVHTGQHYDDAMSSLFFKDLNLPKPDINLEVGSATHAQQTAEIMKRFEPVLLDYKPDIVIVVGDVNSTIACGLVAVKLGIKLAHVEAGLRSFDRSMPEEINRLLTDSISDFLFCTEQSGVDNLLREGISREKIFFVGNVMIDTLLKNKAKADKSKILEFIDLNGHNYAVLTLHRPSNVDCPSVLGSILDAVEVIQRDMPVVFPVHPRTRRNLYSSSFRKKLEDMNKLRLLDPLGYIDFLRVLSSARIVLTDSGGIQEELTVLKIPCLTLRENTERPVTVECGCNRIVGTDKIKIIEEYKRATNEHVLDFRLPLLWDGRASERIVDTVLKELQ